MPIQKSDKQYVPKVKVLRTKFADMAVGEKMAIGTPSMIARLIKTIPKGQELSLSELRSKIAGALKADVACPVTTSIYLKIAIEAEVKEGKTRFSFPFWRAVSVKSKIFKKLSLPVQKIIYWKRSNEGLVD
jgi:hypothetical protein